MAAAESPPLYTEYNNELKTHPTNHDSSYLDNNGGKENITNAIGPIPGLTVVTTALFIVGEMAGSGVLALPKAVINSGWIGLVLIMLCCVVSGYCGVILGECWVILLERYPHYKEHTRLPYPAIGYEAYGAIGRSAVTIAINITLFGVATVFLLIASENVQDILQECGVHFSFCYWLLILAVLLIPATWLGTPKDFWHIALGAMVATALACLLICIGILLGLPTDSPPHKNPGFESFFMAFGTILFSFGGLSTFPTIQHDMKDPKEFPKSVLLSYSIILAMYLPVSALGYFVYGSNLKDNVLKSLPDGVLRYIVEGLLTMHLLLGFVICLNPFFQHTEEFFKLPHKLGIKRMITRTIIVSIICLVAESIPHFGSILSLVGGSTITFLTFICPSLFYLKLCAMKGDWPERYIPLHTKVINYEIIFIGITGGIASTYSAISHMANTFIPPCYVNITAAEAS